MRAHADADNRNLRNLVLVTDAGGGDVAGDGAHQFERAAEIGPRNGKGHIGAAVRTRVLNNHVNDDAGVGDGSENPRGETRTVLDAGKRNLALILVERDARNEYIF